MFSLRWPGPMTAEPELIPARMVNEFVYCPRLFYLEWVDGRFEDSDDTVLGRQVHRAVDTEAGAAPLPEDGDLLAARSLTLSSSQLEIVARLDLVEGQAGQVVPIDIKKGRPQPDGDPWPSDEIQVVLQAMSSPTTDTASTMPRCTTRRPAIGWQSS